MIIKAINRQTGTVEGVIGLNSHNPNRYEWWTKDSVNRFHHFKTRKYARQMMNRIISEFIEANCTSRFKLLLDEH